MKARRMRVWIAAILVIGFVVYCGAIIAANYGVDLIL